MLAVPVLAGSAAYAVARDLRLAGRAGPATARSQGVLRRHRGGDVGRRGASRSSAIDPINALYWSAVINGILAVPLMVLMLLIAANRASWAG